MTAREPITLRLSPETLARLDRLAADLASDPTAAAAGRATRQAAARLALTRGLDALDTAPPGARLALARDIEAPAPVRPELPSVSPAEVLATLIRFDLPTLRAIATVEADALRTLARLDAETLRALARVEADALRALAALDSETLRAFVRIRVASTPSAPALEATPEAPAPEAAPPAAELVEASDAGDAVQLRDEGAHFNVRLNNVFRDASRKRSGRKLRVVGFDGDKAVVEDQAGRRTTIRMDRLTSTAFWRDER